MSDRTVIGCLWFIMTLSVCMMAAGYELIGAMLMGGLGIGFVLVASVIDAEANYAKDMDTKGHKAKGGKRTA